MWPRTVRSLVLSLTLWAAFPGIGRNAAVPLVCRLQIRDPHSHYVEVEIMAFQLRGRCVDFKMPVWIPGSYLVRDFERHVERFEAVDLTGRPLPWKKVSKNTWRVETAGTRTVRVHYWVYAFEENIRGSYVDHELAFLNPSSLVMFVQGQTQRPYHVHLEIPASWKKVSTGLRPLDGDSLTYESRDYDELVDCPIVIGNHVTTFFEVDSVRHEIAVIGRGTFVLDSLTTKIRPLVAEAKKLFGGFPYDRFLFLVWLSDSRGGGLEHRNSCALMMDRFALSPEHGLGGFVSLATHELLHAWNGKAIRPEPLGPFDYDRENYTTLLWFTEGFTTYYSGKLQRRVGVSTPDSYLRSLATQIAAYHAHPGKDVQSLAEASFDAWIKYYKPDENFENSSRSYYGDGALFATLLDLEILHRTRGQRSLDDVMRVLYTRYASRDRWVTLPDLIRACHEVAGSNLDSLFEYVRTTRPMDFAAALEHAGLKIVESGPEAKRAAWLGATLSPEGERVVVTQVRRNSPASRAGLYARDELLAINHYRVTGQNLNLLLSQGRPGDSVRLLVATNGLVRELTAVLEPNPQRELKIVPVENPTDVQKKIYEAWLGAAYPSKTEGP
ncbi:MAG: PDZ domain-containing protein [candidate division KSB1 bacterium]|nr:PDZ domain-containing protein [candidate division KSB1 bacterium]